MTIPIFSSDVNKAYKAAFEVVRPKVIALHTKQFQREGFGDENKTILKEVAVNHLATIYSYLLWWLTNKSNITGSTMDYWKEKTDYTALKTCFKNYHINLDLLIGAITGVEPDASSVVVVGPVPMPTYPGPYESDEEAGNNGVGLGHIYQLSADNYYGMPAGVTKIRVS